MALTQRNIEAVLRGDRNKRVKLRDDIVRGLVLQFGSLDGIWSLEYRPAGINPTTGKRYASRALRLGTVHGMSLAEARAAAGRTKNSIIGGVDPSAERVAKRASQEAAARKAVPSSALLTEFAVALVARGTKDRHLKEELRRTRAAIASVGLLDATASEITKPVLLEVVERSPAGSRKGRLGSLGRFLRWALSRGHIDSNPILLLDRGEAPRPPPSRDRWLSIDELGRLLRAIPALPVSLVLRDLLMLMVTTACRREEAARARWAHIDLEKAIWRQPSTITKNARSHDLPLCSHAMEVLARRRAALVEAGEMQSAADSLVFASPKAGEVFSGWSRLKRALDDASRVTDWRLHDLRRTFASHCAERGVNEVVADLLLNHVASVSRAGVLGVYQKSARWEERRRAMDIWGGVLDEAAGRSEANVVPLRTHS